MNTSTPSTTPSSTTGRSTASGIHRGVWIGGGLMGLAIIALATTLVVKNNDAITDPSAPLAATSSTTSAPTGTSSVAPGPVAVAQQAPAHEAARPVHRNHGNDANPNDRDGSNGRYNESQRVATVAACATCGVIDGYSAVQVQGQNNGVGAVAGGVGGALVGSKITGRSNHTLGGVLGAVGGGLLGNAIEKHERTATVYDVRVRMNDGSIRTVRQSTVPAVGMRVDVDGNTLRAAPDAQG